MIQQQMNNGLKEVNPFVVNKGTLEYRKVRTQEISSSTYGSTPYQPEGTITSRYILVEAHKKTSLYCPSMKLMDELIFEVLSARSRDLLLYIMIHLTDNVDYIKLTHKSLSNKLRMGKSTITKCLKELKTACILAEKSQSVYWINPMYLFKGNRLKYYMNINPDIINEV